jgi:hypothetical protein
MLAKVSAYLEKLGYTSEEQGSLEKYLVVFKDGHPLGFILSDLSVRLVSDVKGAENISEILNFLKKNRDRQSVGNGEFLLGLFCDNKLTTFYDEKDRMVRYATYIFDEKTGEVSSTIFESYDDAAYRFVTQSHMIDFKKYLPKRDSFSEKIRKRIIKYLMSKSKAEQI